jgi:adenylate cyclase
MFVDICGSTQLYETLGDAAASTAVMRCLDRLRLYCEQSGGRVIQRIGDELMCAFVDVDTALKTASLMQQWVSRGESSGAQELGIRIGCHFGPVIEERGELFGDSVNVAARVAAFAREGQVITTAETVSALSPTLGACARALGSFSAKGKREGLAIHEFLWQGGGDAITVMDINLGALRTSRLILRYEGRTVTLTSSERRALMLGRENSCDVVIADSRASRKHARIETRLDHFVLIDQSINGTFVKIAGGNELRLRHEEMILHASGIIGFGNDSGEERLSVARFLCR